MKNINIDALHQIQKNVTTVIDALRQTIKRTTDPSLLEQIQRYLCGCLAVSSDITAALASRNSKAQDAQNWHSRPQWRLQMGKTMPDSTYLPACYNTTLVWGNPRPDMLATRRPGLDADVRALAERLRRMEHRYEDAFRMNMNKYTI